MTNPGPSRWYQFAKYGHLAHGLMIRYVSVVLTVNGGTLGNVVHSPIEPGTVHILLNVFPENKIFLSLKY